MPKEDYPEGAPFTREEIVFTAYYMAAHGFEPSEIARLIEKPWNYAEEFKLATECEDCNGEFNG